MSKFNWLYVRYIALVIFLLSLSGMGLGQTISDEARRHMDRGVAAVESAATEAELEDAVNEFRQATRLAPDWPDAYFNLAKVEEKLGLNGPAIADFRSYLRLAPEATDIQEVTRIINRLEYKLEQEQNIGRVYERLASPAFRKKVLTRKGTACAGPLEMRIINGKLVEFDYRKNWYPEEGVRRLVPDTNPVSVNGQRYEYRFVHYQCDMSVSKYEGAPPYCPFDVAVKGEIVSMAPLTVKEVLTISSSWRSRHNPVGCPTGIAEYVWEVVPQ